jgi:hypothetical protein
MTVSMMMSMTASKTLAKALTLRRGLILSLSALACTYVLMAPGAAPGLSQFDCAAPQYFDTLTGFEPDAAHETGMVALRQQAGLALAQLQGRTGGN